jgi:hypothetical protein
VRVHCTFKTTTKDSLTRIERDCSQMGTVNQSRFLLLEAEYLAKGIAIEYLCASISTWIGHI